MIKIILPLVLAIILWLLWRQWSRREGVRNFV